MNLSERVIELVGLYMYGDYEMTHADGGRELRVRCPFHKEGRERRPSFYWNLITGMFFCHTCHVGGGLPRFLKLVEMPRSEIARILENTDYNEQHMRLLTDPFRKKKKTNVLRANPVLPEGLLATFDFESEYMTRRGFSSEILAEYDIGMDLINQRVTFPIRDVFGRFIGMSGRALQDSAFPRYKIYREEFDDLIPGYRLEKSLTLWNVDRVWAQHMSRYGTRKEDNPIIVVEGFKAALYLLQLGYENTVALMGSTISDVQIYILSVIGADLIVFLDNDAPGRRGTKKVTRALRRNSPCRVFPIYYPEGMDDAQPDDLSPDTIETLTKETYVNGRQGFFEKPEPENPRHPTKAAKRERC